MVDPKKDDAGPRLLSGGNPQIPKGEGDGPVQAYIAAAPGWKQEAARRLDALIVQAVSWYLRYPLSYRNLEEMMQG